MVDYTKQDSSPLHLENTIGQIGKKELHINNRFDTFHQMKRDAVISGSLSFLYAIMNRPVHIKEHPNATENEKRLTKKLNESLDQMDAYTKREMVNNFLTALTYGCSVNEMVFKQKDSWWVFDTVSPIHLTSIRKFKMKKGKLIEIEMVNPDNDGLIEDITSKEKTISGDKLVVICMNKSQDNPLGESILTAVWQAWKSKQIISEYQVIGTAKSFGNIVSIKIPSDYITEYLTNPGSEEAIYTQHLMQQSELLHAGKTSHVILPSDVYEGGQSQFDIAPITQASQSQNGTDTTINRLNDEMMLSLQTSLLSLGQEGGGSFALSESKTNLLTMSVRAVHETIVDGFQKAIRRAYELNGLPLTRMPTLEFEDVEPVDFDTVSKYWQRLVMSGAVVPEDSLDNYLRKLGGAPEADPNSGGFMERARQRDAGLDNNGSLVENERVEKEG